MKNIEGYQFDRDHLEFIRHQANERFQPCLSTWIECGSWALPHRTKWMLAQRPGERNNRHIVDATHVLALRSFVAGFLEGNTSASRPWARVGHPDPDRNRFPEHRQYMDNLTIKCMNVLGTSNFYHAAGAFYYDFGVFNTGCHYIDEIGGRLHFHTLMPGSYKVLNNAHDEAIVLVREMRMSVKQLVQQYGRKKNGAADWSNFSTHVRECYERCDYSQQVDVVHIVMENPQFDFNKAQYGLNRKWISWTYESAVNGPTYLTGVGPIEPSGGPYNADDGKKFLNVSASKRKPFIVGKSDSGMNFEYGEKGPTLDALGLIRSLNKKAISKDQALEQMLRPAVQGPAHLKKSYLTTAPNQFIPLDAQSAAKGGGLRPVFEINPAIGALIQDVSDIRNAVDKLYYADFLLFLSQNPKTRTATEAAAVVEEQQRVIGPNLQSLNWTYNTPIWDFLMDFVIDTDPDMYEVPIGLQGEFIRPEFISVFAQAQKAADLPSLDRYVDRMVNLASLRPDVWDKVNLDRYADLYEDRLFLPAGLNNAQSKVERLRQQAAAQAARQQALNETLPAVAGAAKDLGIQMNQGPQQV